MGMNEGLPDGPTAGAPRVSVLIAVRNEARHLAHTLQSLVAQDCPAHWLEVLVIDGQSSDDTVAIAQSFAGRLPGLQVLSNPRILSAAGWNLGLQQARAGVITILSGHVLLAPDHLRRLLAQLTPARCAVGGRAIPVGEDARSELIARAFSSRLGNGGASFMAGGPARAVESVAFGCYWRNAVQAVGGFDERIVRGQDWDLNLRLRMAGHELWYLPEVEVRYQTRADHASMARRQYLAGLWKPFIHRKNARPFLWRHWVPAAFVGVLAFSLVAGLFDARALWLAVLVLGAHALAAGVQLRRLGMAWAQAPLFWWTLLVIHGAYGLGFLLGHLRPPRAGAA